MTSDIMQHLENFTENFCSTISNSISMSAKRIMLTAITGTLLSSNYVVCATFRCCDRKKMTHQCHLHFAHTAILLIRVQSFGLFILGYFISIVFMHTGVVYKSYLKTNRIFLFCFTRVKVTYIATLVLQDH